MGQYNSQPIVHDFSTSAIIEDNVYERNCAVLMGFREWSE